MKHRDSPLSSNVRPPPTASAWPLSAPNVPFPPTKPQLRSALPPLRRAAHAREECPIRLASLAGDHPSSERMTRVEHSEATIGELRAEYFRQRGFPADGGSSARWVRYPLFGGHIVLPNVKSRQRALPLHDLHHLVTGYDTSWRGEAEIAAWELAAGCHGYVAAWVLNLAAFAIGVVIAPRRLWRAFVRGRASTTLYRHHWSDRYLSMRLAELRELLGVADAPHGTR
jgi:hypothetical protein